MEKLQWYHRNTKDNKITMNNYMAINGQIHTYTPQDWTRKKKQRNQLPLTKWIRENPSKQKSLTGSLQGEFYQIFKDELTPILLNLLKKIAEETIHPNSFHEASNAPLTKPNNDITKSKTTSQYH